MRIVAVDAETFWDGEYSLSKMSPLAYVMDDRFELISMSIKVDNYPTDVLFGDEIQKAMSKMDWSDSLVIGHNLSGFDAYILAYRLGIRPRMWGCTAAMARPWHAKTTGVGLGKLVEHYADELRAMGIASRKDNAVLMQTRGRHLSDFTAQELRDMEVYNRNDTEQCRGLFHILRKKFSAAELWQIDALTRMRTEPMFELDVGLLETAASIERDRKRKSLISLAQTLRGRWEAEPAYDGADSRDFGDDDSTFWDDEDQVAEFVRSELASAPKFAALLERLGVEVPMKPSPTNPEGQIPALAKSDEAFLRLQQHPDEMVAAAARARLDVKSTLLETRIEKFLEAGRLAGGRLPIPLRYCGADTTGRDSGEEYNPQNMPRIVPGKPKPSDSLRRSLRAPDGYLVIVADQSGIELRTNHFLWKVESSMEMYRASPDKADLYRAFAAESLFRIPPEEVDKSQRQVGKVAQLGLGFGSGAQTFQRIARIMGGIDMPLEAEEGLSAEFVVTAWRAAYENIVNGWRTCAVALHYAQDGRKFYIDPWELTHTEMDAIVLPSGRRIYYPNLREMDDGAWPDGRPRRSWFYGEGRHLTRLTGPKVCENIVQALARDSIFDCAVEFFRRTGLRPALRVHDELVYVVPKPRAEGLLDTLQGILRTPPKWWPELIVWSEGSLGKTYADAK